MLWNSPHCPYVSKTLTLPSWSYLGQSILYLHPDILHPVSFIPKSSGYFLLEVISKLAYSNQYSISFLSQVNLPSPLWIVSSFLSHGRVPSNSHQHLLLSIFSVCLHPSILLLFLPYLDFNIQICSCHWPPFSGNSVTTVL